MVFTSMSKTIFLFVIAFLWIAKLSGNQSVEKNTSDQTIPNHDNETISIHASKNPDHQTKITPHTIDRQIEIWLFPFFTQNNTIDDKSGTNLGFLEDIVLTLRNEEKTSPNIKNISESRLPDTQNDHFEESAGSANTSIQSVFVDKSNETYNTQDQSDIENEITDIHSRSDEREESIGIANFLRKSDEMDSGNKSVFDPFTLTTIIGDYFETLKNTEDTTITSPNVSINSYSASGFSPLISSHYLLNNNMCCEQAAIVTLPASSTKRRPLIKSKKKSVIEDIEVYNNNRIESFIHLYTVKKRGIFIKAIERSPEYMGMIHRIFDEHGLPSKLAYLAIVESNLNPNARSHANAVGLWQFMSGTGKYFGLSRSWWHDERYDPEKSTIAAAKFLKRLYKQFNGHWELVLAAYNSGPGTVRRAIRKAKAQNKSSDYWSLKLPRETRGYVPAFFAVATIFNNLEKYGFTPPPNWEVEEEKQMLMVAGGISLSQIAKVLKIGHQVLEEINPSLRFKGLIPPVFDVYEIAIPFDIQLTDVQKTELEKLKDERHESWKFHRVEQGDSLWSISRYYRIPIKKIKDYNRLKRKNLLRIGQKLMLPVPADWNPPKRKSTAELTRSKLDKLPGVTHVHVVKKGDTLWTISQKYNIPIKTIRRWNKRILRSKFLKIGTEIILKLPVTIADSSI